jgi:ABC-type nitrate/sulfonate/bicarbonate transport system substrate-binding protein
MIARTARFVAAGYFRTNSKGKTVAVPGLGTSHHFFVASIAAYVGLDPSKDINFITPSLADSVQLFVEGKIDAIFDFPPVPQELRAKKLGHVVVGGPSPNEPDPYRTAQNSRRAFRPE